MTEMAAEAGTAEVEGEARDAPRAARRVTSRTGPGRRAPAARTRVATRVVRATPQGRAATTAARVAPSRPRGSQRRLAPFPGGGVPHKGNYHGVILAEWLAGSLLIIAIPLSRKNRTGVSPYSGSDLVQLGSYTVLFWVLAIVAATGGARARFAAWFGGLILLAVGLAEAANIASAVSTWLNPPAKPKTPKPAGNVSVVNPGVNQNSPTGSSRAVAQQPGTGLS